MDLRGKLKIDGTAIPESWSRLEYRAKTAPMKFFPVAIDMRQYWRIFFA
jgi:hypothetical protein